MDIELARTFLEVIDAGSFLGAAARLHVTQSTVSARIRTLEERMGRRLFVRNKAGTVLTPAGVQFQRHAAILVRTWEQARQDVALPAGYRAVLAVGGQAGLWNRLLYRWLPWMSREAPDVAVRAELGSPDSLMRELIDGVLDIGVMYTPQSRPGLRIERLIEEELILVSTTPKAGIVHDSGYVYVDWGREFHIAHRRHFPDFSSPRLFVGLGTLGFQYVVDNGGSGYFPASLAQPYIDSGVLGRIDGAPTFTLPIYAVTPDPIESDALATALRGLREIAAKPVAGPTPGEPA